MLKEDPGDWILTPCQAQGFGDNFVYMEVGVLYIYAKKVSKKIILKGWGGGGVAGGFHQSSLGVVFHQGSTVLLLCYEESHFEKLNYTTACIIPNNM